MSAFFLDSANTSFTIDTRDYTFAGHSATFTIKIDEFDESLVLSAKDLTVKIEF